MATGDLVADRLLVEGAEGSALHCRIGTLDLADGVLRDGPVGLDVRDDCGGTLERVSIETEPVLEDESSAAAR